MMTPVIFQGVQHLYIKEAIPGSNPRKDNVTSLISDGITHTNPTSMSIFSKLFATIGIKLAEKFTMRNKLF